MPYDEPPFWYDDPFPAHPSLVDELDRLTHLVLVDGRLVDVWSEPVGGTRWARHADRFDHERRPALPPPPPPPPAHEQVAAWLREVCGSEAAVTALDTAPLRRDGLDLPSAWPDVRSGHRMESTAGLLDEVAREWFDEEVACAMRRALLSVWHADPDAVRAAKSTAHLAAGVCWVVGKANELFRPGGAITQTQLRDALGLTGTLSGPGGTVQRAVRGLGEFPSPPGLGIAGRSLGVPDLLALGDVDLLTSTTRARLVRLRDRAVRAAAAA